MYFFQTISWVKKIFQFLYVFIFFGEEISENGAAIQYSCAMFTHFYKKDKNVMETELENGAEKRVVL